MQFDDPFDLLCAASCRFGADEQPAVRLGSLLEPLTRVLNADSGALYLSEDDGEPWKRARGVGEEDALFDAILPVPDETFLRTILEQFQEPGKDSEEDLFYLSDCLESAGLPKAGEFRCEFFVLPIFARPLRAFFLIESPKGKECSEKEKCVLRIFLTMVQSSIEMKFLEEEGKKLQESVRNLQKDKDLFRSEMKREMEEHFRGFKEVEQQIAKQEKIRTFAALAGKLGHEMKNSFGVLSNCLYFVRRKLKDIDPDAERHFEIMEKEIWKGTQFISSLIDYSRLDVANPVPCDVNGILKECCSHVPFSDRIQIHFSLQEDIPCIHGDKERLKQAFSHLMVNAAEAMAIGGTLTISTKRRGDCLEVDFLDTGSGIKNEDYARLAEPFYSTKGTDLGLGLLFCQSVLQCHGGSLSIQSVPGKGTLCQVRIATPS